MSSRPHIVAFGIVVLAAIAARGPSAQTPTPDGTFSMALTGNSIMTRPLAIYREPPFLNLIELLRGADASMTVFESVFSDYESYATTETNTALRTDPALAKDLVWAGFDLIALAHNHSHNFGEVGARLTRKYLKDVGLVAAGTGESLAEAREAKFLETPKARVALISVASTYASHSAAGKTRGDIPARPGVNPLRFSTTYIVPPEQMAQLRGLLTELKMPAPAASAERLRFLGQTFVTGDKAEVRTEPNSRDVAEIAAVVSNASRLADYTIVTSHTHESDGSDTGMPPQFLVKFAHAMIDAGADAFWGHGALNIRGVELYKGKPILYALGNFTLGVDTPTRKPVDSFEDRGLGPDAGVADWNEAGGRMGPQAGEGLVATARWRGHELVELALHPISLGYAKKRGIEYGRPMLADAAMSQKIGNDLIQRSKPFGTRITIREGVAYVGLDSSVSRKQ